MIDEDIVANHFALNDRTNTDEGSSLNQLPESWSSYHSEVSTCNQTQYIVNYIGQYMSL